ncbi:hypothetical protein AAMO2058_001582200 [Amorphochlora amoebiformis]
MLRVADRLLGLKQRKASQVLPVFGFQTLNQAINLHKALCFFVILSMILYHGKIAQITPCVYLAIHGSYGFAWILKYIYFPDWGFEIELNLPIFLFCFLSAAVHWITSWIIVTNPYEAPGLLICAALMLYTMGMFFMYVGDAQKFFMLKYRPGRLIREGVFRHTRNPNYLGEIMIYSGYCLLSRHWLPWAICVSFWIFLFLPNIMAKEKSLSRYKNWELYCSHSGLVVPHIFALN